jgi:Phosphomannose isomerase type I
MATPSEGAFAAALRRRDPDAVQTTLGAAVFPVPAAVARPWGGDAIGRLRGQPPAADAIGESFELSAARSDPEAAAHPSTVVLPDGDRMALCDLLHACPAILGEEHVLAFGHELPLLPKLLDIQSLLSVQAHPPGHPELYVVLAAEAGASLRLGLRDDTDLAELTAELRHGAALQRELAAYVGGHADLARDISAWLLGPPTTPLPQAIARVCAPVLATLVDLRRLATDVVGRMHELPVEPGMAIHNRVGHPADGRSTAALHALGNAGGLGVLALEIRRAGPTLRAWDHGRLPARPLDIEGALAQVPLAAAPVDEFIVAHAGQPFAIDNGVFSAERLFVGPQGLARAGRGRAEFIHVCSGSVVLGGGRSEATLSAGTSALVPAAWSGWSLRA